MDLGRSGFRHIGAGLYVKYEPATGIRTTIRFERKGDGPGLMRVRHDQRVDNIIELNKIQQNEFRGYRHDLMTQVTRIPLLEHRKIMEKCGYQPGHGYDQKRFARILNDPDYRFFKTVSARL